MRWCWRTDASSKCSPQPEPLAEIACTDLRQLVRLAYHFGNRHLPVQIVGQKLRIRRDHVIEDMARQGGARVTEIEAPFDPEGGAYSAELPAAGGHEHEQGHGHTSMTTTVTPTIITTIRSSLKGAALRNRPAHDGGLRSPHGPSPGRPDHAR